MFQMLEDRGYVCHKDDVDMTFENFKQIYTEDPEYVPSSPFLSFCAPLPPFATTFALVNTDGHS